MRDENGLQLYCKWTGKASYSQKQAFIKLNQLKKYKKAAHKQHPIRAYRCEYCQKWHLTSKKQYK